CRQRIVFSLEREKPFLGRQKGAESGFLSDHRAARGEIAGTPIAEPTAVRGCVAALGNRKLSPRVVNEGAILIGCSRYHFGSDQLPAFGGEASQISGFLRIRSKRQLHSLPAL